jgi:hypothetical protein
MGYSFKGRGILWHSETGPVKWWPINWFWMFVVNFEQERRRKLEEAAEAAEAKAAEAKAAEAKPAAAPPVEPEPVTPGEAAAAAAVAASPIAEAIAPAPQAGSEMAPPPPPEPEHLGQPDKPAEPPKG